MRSDVTAELLLRCLFPVALLRASSILHPSLHINCIALFFFFQMLSTNCIQLYSGEAEGRFQLKTPYTTSSSASHRFDLRVLLDPSMTSGRVMLRLNYARCHPLHPSALQPREKTTLRGEVSTEYLTFSWQRNTEFPKIFPCLPFWFNYASPWRMDLLATEEAVGSVSTQIRINRWRVW